MSEAIIQLTNLSKSYGSLKAVDCLNLNIRKGEIFGLLGPNGAGKTTTILMLLGLTEPDAGEVRVCRHNSTNDPIAVKKKVGYMPDSLGFYDDMTAWQNLMYIGELNGIPKHQLEQLCLECIRSVGLDEQVIHKRTSTFSRGTKQRLGLAEVLIKQPEVIILDEPTLGIDPIGVKEFLDLILKMSREKGLTVLLSSHHLEQVQQVCDRMGIFVKGKLMAEGDLESLARHLQTDNHFQVQVTLQHTLPNPWKDEEKVLDMEAVENVAVNGQTLDISLSKDITPDLVRFFAREGYDVTGVQKKGYHLEDIYQSYF
ncbi:MAG: ABC transporter ATP-binding protein [Cyclobacteriaceae bacterium]